MGQLTDMINKFQNIVNNVEPSARRAFLETQDDYIDLNLDQLAHGLNADGEKIGKYALEEYAIYKFEQNPLPGFGFVDLRLDGGLYGGAYASLRGNVITIQSIDPKNANIELKYGTIIWGLSADRKTLYINKNYRPSLIKQLGL